MRVREGLGQLKMTGKICDEYALKSLRPYPYKSEEMLVEEKEIEDLNPVWSDEVYKKDWSAAVPAPSIPSTEKEVYRIRRGMSRLRWNKAGPWNMNPGPDSLEGFGEEAVDITPAVTAAVVPAISPEMVEVSTVSPNYAGVGAGIAAASLVGGAISTLEAIAIFRVVGREPSAFWKAMLLFAGIGSCGMALVGLFGVGAGVAMMAGVRPK